MNILKKIFYNFGGIFAISIGIIFFIFEILLPTVTHHNKILIMPNITGLYLDEAKKILKENKLKYKVLKNDLYTLSYPANTIIEQNPIADSIIKPGRTIYIKLNPEELPKITIPRLGDKSIRNVYSIIKSLGFKIGKISYINDIADNVIIKAYLSNKDLEDNEKISIGSSINLVIGVNNLETEIKDFYGITEHEIESRLLENKLQLGKIIYKDENLKEDNTPRIVVGQSKIFQHVKCGTKIDIELAHHNPQKSEEDTNKINEREDQEDNKEN